MRAPFPSEAPAPRRGRRFPFVAALLLACAGIPRAEFSPLSIHEEGFGLGVSPHGVREKGMGEAGMASVTGQGLSVANPSRAAFHDKTSFTAIADGDIDWLRDDETSNRFATFLIPAIGLDFNLRKYGHLGLFYRQRFHRNFSFTPLVPARADAVQTFSTEGGLYEAAAFYALAPLPSLAISLGFHYYMGRERLIESASFTGEPGSEDLFQGQDLAGDTVFTRSQGGRPSLAMTLRRPKFSLAVSGAMGVTLDQRISRSVTNLQSDRSRDASQELPWTVSAGAAYKWSPRQTWVADFTWEGWEEEGSGLLNPAFAAGIGYEFQGRGGLYEPYFSKLAYRGGLGMERLYLEETDLYYLTAGLGMPLGRRGSLLDFAIKYGHRGSAKNNLWSEDYVKLSISLTGVGNWGQPVRKRR
jgi:long-chain fatty acid transport protein